MAFTPVCRKDAVTEGGMGLAEGCFDGQRVVCHIHQWGYDAGNGKCVSHAHPSALHAYALQVEGEDILVDVGPIRSARVS